MSDPAFVDVRDAVRLLGIAVASHGVYGSGHARTSTACATFATAARDTGGFRALLVGPSLAWNGIPLRGNAVIDRLADMVRERKLAGIEVTGDARARDIEGLHRILAGGAEDAEPGSTVRALTQWTPRHPAPHADIVERHPEFGLSLALYNEVARCLETTMRDAASGTIDVVQANQVTARVCDAIIDGGVDMLGPVHLVQANTYTWQHSVNVFLLALNVLQHLCDSREQLLECAQAALFHDVGKSRIPAWLLNKPTTLTEDERRLLQKHTEHGAEILGSHDGVHPLACEVAYCHHMRDNGHGYPAPHPSLRPGPVTDVVQVADMLEALMSWRPYKEPMSFEEALKTVRRTKGMASKEPVISMLVHSLSPYPTGAFVTLQEGRAGTILDPGPPIRVRLDGDEPLVVSIDPELVAAIQPRPIPA